MHTLNLSESERLALMALLDCADFQHYLITSLDGDPVSELLNVRERLEALKTEESQ